MIWFRIKLLSNLCILYIKSYVEFARYGVKEQKSYHICPKSNKPPGDLIEHFTVMFFNSLDIAEAITFQFHVKVKVLNCTPFSMIDFSTRHNRETT